MKATARIAVIAPDLTASAVIEDVADGWPDGGMATAAAVAETAASRLADANHVASLAVPPVAGAPAETAAADPIDPLHHFGTHYVAAPGATANSIGVNGTTTRRDAAIPATSAATGLAPAQGVPTGLLTPIPTQLDISPRVLTSEQRSNRRCGDRTSMVSVDQE